MAEVTAFSSCLSALHLYLILSKSSNSPNQIIKLILLPTYDFSLYAIDHWIDHLQALSTTQRLIENSGELSRESISTRIRELASACEENFIDNVKRSDESDVESTRLEATWQSLNLELSTRKTILRYLVPRVVGYSSGPITRHSKHGKLHRMPMTDSCVVDTAVTNSGRMLSPLRCQYQEMVENALNFEERANEEVKNFKARRGLGGYLCRHQSCHHSAVGFDSADLRQEHEYSHGPRFQCCEAKCSFFGWTCRSRTAMKAHEKKYHLKQGSTNVPINYQSTRM